MEKNLNLYNQAKEAYYSGNPIMSDIEFDELETSLGLENKSYIGTRHNPSYTIKHPYIMGSLSKIQIKASCDGSIEWEKYFEEMQSYVCRNFKNSQLILSPKYDGCSFECVVEKYKVQSISSRGDGEYGKDLYKHLINKVLPNVDAINKKLNSYTFRGEVLINKNIFEAKYSEYVNPRSFVAGILGSDYEDTKEFIEVLNDLSIVIYDIKVIDSDEIVDFDFDNFEYPDSPEFYFNIVIPDSTIFSAMYTEFDKYRKRCEFALDGFVIKPIDINREINFTRTRPLDCVAIKFLPMMQETIVEDIIWSSRKTNELIPVVKVKPIIMDGKEISRASAHNYGYLIDNKISVGTKIVLSLAGDIIPFIYKVTDSTDFDVNKLNLPSDINTVIDGCHLNHIMNDDELTKKKFVNSGLALKIPGLGQANIEKLFRWIESEYSGDEFFEIESREIPDNILCLTDTEIQNGIEGKIGMSVAKEFVKLMHNLTLKDIITSLCIEDCGSKIIEEIEKYFLGKNADFTHLNRNAYSWILDQNSENYRRLMNILNKLNMTIEDFKINVSNSDNNIEQIPVILTGEPNDYASKGEFLKCHPEYRLTGSWKECKIVFTNSMDSKTGKMKKAIEKGIEIRLY